VGEYAVVEPGGRGLSLAPNVRATCTVEVGDPRRSAAGITARFGGETAHFSSADEAGYPAIFAAVDQVCGEILGRPTGEMFATAKVTVDTEAFYLGSRKLGFGSSAAAAVCLTAATLAGAENVALAVSSAAETRAEAAATKKVLSAAVRAHRIAQGGRGSGYDVATSFAGGTCAFVGGPEPAVERVSLPWLPSCYLYRGPHEVSTSAALGSYRRWKSRAPVDSRSYVAETNGVVDALVKARNWNEARLLLARAAAIGEELGCQIAVDATPAVFSRSGTLGDLATLLNRLPEEHFFTKSLGAGNETGVLMIHEPDEALHHALLDAGLTPLTVSADGVRLT
jgi:phosphomevalonate kinase